MMHEAEVILNRDSQEASKYWKFIWQDRDILWYIIKSDVIDTCWGNVVFTLTWKDAGDSLRDQPGAHDGQVMHVVLCAVYGRQS
jgi:hypothetical protein